MVDTKDLSDSIEKLLQQVSELTKELKEKRENLTKEKSVLEEEIRLEHLASNALSGSDEDTHAEENKESDENPLVSVGNTPPHILPILPIYAYPFFPGIMLPLTIASENWHSGLEKVIRPNQFIGLLLVKREFEKTLLYNLHADMLYSIGTVARINRRTLLPNGSISLLVTTLNRFEVQQVIHEEPVIECMVSHIKEKSGARELEIDVLINIISKQVDYVSKGNSFLGEQLKNALDNSEYPSRIADFVASILIDVEKERLQDILETIPVHHRLEKVAILMEERIRMLKIQENITEQINTKVESQQREFFLKEQLRIIQKELGLDKDEKTKILHKFEERFQMILPYIPEETKKVIQEELDKLSFTESRAPDYNVLYNYLDTLLFLPWIPKKRKSISLKKAKQILDDTHYGIEETKQRILEFLAIHKLKPESKGAIICLVGPPGVGKTSLGKAIAESLHRPFYRFSVGGMRDEAEIKGHRRTYIGAMPGKIIQGLKTTQDQAPVFMIDEIDKMGNSYQGDPASALLEVLDKEQNTSFRDHYLDVPFDLSNILFITTANNLSTIPAPLLDRMEVISLSGYIAEEKYYIGKKFLIKKHALASGISEADIVLGKKEFLYIIEKYSREAGIRGFEKQIERLCRKIAYKKVVGETIPQPLTKKDIGSMLGPEVFSHNEKKRIEKAGVSIGLAWTSLGGDTLYIESILVPKQTGFKVSGQLGNVMQESASIAYSYIQHIAQDYHIPLEIFHENMIHIHVPAGAVPKDGPSAGITIASSLFSLLKNIKFPVGFAMTGELTLSGNVLPIGGIKEKSMAAIRSGLKHIILPQENVKDLADIPDYIKKDLTYHPVSRFEEVLHILFPKSR